MEIPKDKLTWSKQLDIEKTIYKDVNKLNIMTDILLMPKYSKREVDLNRQLYERIMPQIHTLKIKRHFKDLSSRPYKKKKETLKLNLTNAFDKKDKDALSSPRISSLSITNGKMGRTYNFPPISFNTPSKETTTGKMLKSKSELTMVLTPQIKQELSIIDENSNKIGHKMFKKFNHPMRPNSSQKRMKSFAKVLDVKKRKYRPKKANMLYIQSSRSDKSISGYLPFNEAMKINFCDKVKILNDEKFARSSKFFMNQFDMLDKKNRQIYERYQEKLKVEKFLNHAKENFNDMVRLHYNLKIKVK